jgi:AcrR family transcriptional regulator
MLAKTKRSRNSEDTRARILKAAKIRFSIDNYDHVGVRDIAADAGVDAAMVNRYFGSKEKLFMEAIIGVFRLDKHLPEKPSLDKLGSQIAADLMSEDDCCKWNDDCDPLQLLLRSAVSPTASSAVSEVFHNEFVLPLAKLIGGPNAKLRAAVICAYAIGFGTMRVIMKSRAIKPKDTKMAAALLAKSIQACVDNKTP